MKSLRDNSPGVAGRRPTGLMILFILAWGLTGCLVRHREKIPTASAPNSPVWRTASLDDLLATIRTQQDAISTLSATTTIEPAVKSIEKGEIVNYRDVKAFILIRKPADIRVIGLYPVVQNKAFDMASDGVTFRLYLPAKNRFMAGKTRENEHPSKSAIENLRPQHILDALLVRGPDPASEEAVLEVYSDGSNSFYIIHILRNVPGHWPVLARNIWFERRGLLLARQEVFDATGEAVTDVLYGDYVPASGISYPREIVVNRPRDFYSFRLAISDLTLNEPIGDDKFVLEQPPGTELVDMDQPSASNNGGNGG